jgi:hypothetical protein
MSSPLFADASSNVEPGHSPISHNGTDGFGP